MGGATLRAGLKAFPGLSLTDLIKSRALLEPGWLLGQGQAECRGVGHDCRELEGLGRKEPWE